MNLRGKSPGEHFPVRKGFPFKLMIDYYCNLVFINPVSQRNQKSISKNFKKRMLWQTSINNEYEKKEKRLVTAAFSDFVEAPDTRFKKG